MTTHNRWHILLLRHGLTDANAGNVIQGHRPTPLNALGHEQARRLAGRLVEYAPRLTQLISSDLPRAVQTAEPIGRACGLELRLDDAWRERCFGEMEGKSAAECDIWRAAAGEIDPPGAESAAGFMDRIAGALNAVQRQHPPESVVGIVTHGGPCRAILRMLIDGRLPLAEPQQKPELAMIANCSIMHLIHRAGGAWELKSLNDVAHLADLGATLRDAG